MTVLDHPVQGTESELGRTQRFIFERVDWAFYEFVGQKLAEQRIFATYYKGRLEVVTVSFTHERIVALLSQMIWILAEETNTQIISAGMTTLKRSDLEEGVEPDLSYYTAHQLQMASKREIDLAVDPPPDLAIEVEVTHRLAQRQTIYRDMGVPEIWVYHQGDLTILLRRGEQYEAADRSPTFEQFQPAELAGAVSAGLAQEGIAWSKAFRARVREIIAGAPPKA